MEKKKFKDFIDKDITTLKPSILDVADKPKNKRINIYDQPDHVRLNTKTLLKKKKNRAKKKQMKKKKR